MAEVRLMSTNAKWGHADWGQTPSSLSRQTPLMFLHRPELDADYAGTYGMRFALHHDPGVRAANATSLTALIDEMRARDESMDWDEVG